MRYVNKTILSAVDTGDATSDLVDSSQLFAASFQAYFGDATAAGAVKVQASNDPAPEGYMNSPSGFAPTNWVDVPSATATVTAGAPVVIAMPQIAYRWLQVVFTHSGGGSTTITVNLFAQAL